jgi:hypothetical protein
MHRHVRVHDQVAGKRVLALEQLQRRGSLVVGGRSGCPRWRALWRTSSRSLFSGHKEQAAARHTNTRLAMARQPIMLLVCWSATATTHGLPWGQSAGRSRLRMIKAGRRLPSCAIVGRRPRRGAASAQYGQINCLIEVLWHPREVNQGDGWRTNSRARQPQ